MITEKVQKAARNRFMYDVGLSKTDHWLLYRNEGGFGYTWMPARLKHAIVDVWNFFACWRFGHQSVGPIEGEEGEECMHCCAKIEEVKGEKSEKDI